MSFVLRYLSVALAMVLPGAGVWAKDYEVVTRSNLGFAQHDGASKTAKAFGWAGLVLLLASSARHRGPLSSLSRVMLGC
jgi:hypothetical protein